jgi:hypothetical protein
MKNNSNKYDNLMMSLGVCLPSNVARTGFFRLVDRKDNTLHFKTGIRYASSCSGKVLTNQKTCEEICFVDYRGSRIMLEASRYMSGGSRVTREEMDTLRTDDGRYFPVAHRLKMRVRVSRYEVQVESLSYQQEQLAAMRIDITEIIT